jgi:CRP/FNR family transcriptional regulator, nitrogen fixation regulation protein
MTLAYPLDDPPAACPSKALSNVLDRFGTRLTVAKDTEIYAQEDEVEFLYRVVDGVVRTMRLTCDGRRQVGDFYYPGELFGLEPGPDHQFSAEALSDCTVLVVRRSVVRAQTGDRELDRAILEATRRELQRVQDHVLLLGRKSAREKVAGFLMSLAQQQNDNNVQLPMGRQDMADYLGLTIETVSRTLTRLQHDAIVEFPALRRFRVTRWDALEDLAA